MNLTFPIWYFDKTYCICGKFCRYKSAFILSGSRKNCATVFPWVIWCLAFSIWNCPLRIASRECVWVWSRWKTTWWKDIFVYIKYLSSIVRFVWSSTVTNELTDLFMRSFLCSPLNVPLIREVTLFLFLFYLHFLSYPWQHWGRVSRLIFWVIDTQRAYLQQWAYISYYYLNVNFFFIKNNKKK